MPHPARATTGRQGQLWWDERYTSGQTGWDRPGHATQLERAVTRLNLPLCRALDIGCGRGRNSRWLAEQGFSMVGVDISEVAIADAQAAQGALDCEFHRLDILTDPIPGGPFGVVFDYGCFHVFDEDDDRDTLARKLAGVLEPGGLYVAVIGSTDGPPRDMGPPRRSAVDVVRALEPWFEILELVRGVIRPGEDPERPTWELVARRRAD
jgi:SAM-dependent methyltransferase